MIDRISRPRSARRSTPQSATDSAEQAADGDLLTRFVESRDEAAFDALLERHGGMVFDVCRRVLGNTHAAEDAFQTIFLELARSADTIRDRRRLSSWLYAVAQRKASKLRTAEARRRRRERTVSPAEPDDPTRDAADEELGRVLDEEIGRLPEKYRAPFVLCCVEGLSHEAAARQLGEPRGSISWYVGRSKRILRSRLARRGIVASIAALFALLRRDSQAATGSRTLRQATSEYADAEPARRPNSAASRSARRYRRGLQATLVALSLLLVFVFSFVRLDDLPALRKAPSETDESAPARTPPSKPAGHSC